MFVSVTRALDPAVLPPAYGPAFAEQNARLTEDVRGCVLDWGCGIGSNIEAVLQNPTVPSYVGVDINRQASQVAWMHGKSLTHLDGANRSEVFQMDAMSSYRFGNKSFDTVMCMWNTLHIIDNGETNALRWMELLARERIILSFARKGSLDTRLAYYEALGSPVTVDEDTETIYSPLWGASPAFHEEEVESLLWDRVHGHPVRSISINDVLTYTVWKVSPRPKPILV